MILGKEIIPETFRLFRKCGAGARECVAFWTGPADHDFVDGVEHPVHISSRGGYTVDDCWLTQFWRTLGQERRSIKAQVHTHPAEAFHSSIDDDWPIVWQRGFVSIVVPNFALGPVSLNDAWIGCLGANGKWEQLQSATDALNLI